MTGKVSCWKWKTLSTGYGTTRSKLTPFTFSDGARFWSPTSQAMFIRSSRTGVAHWIGNVSREAGTEEQAALDFAEELLAGVMVAGEGVAGTAQWWRGDSGSVQARCPPFPALRHTVPPQPDAPAAFSSGPVSPPAAGYAYQEVVWPSSVTPLRRLTGPDPWPPRPTGARPLLKG